MNIQFTSVVHNANQSWTVTWAGTGTWRVVLWGELLTTTTSNTYTWNGQEYTDFPPPLVVVPAGEQALSEEFSPYLVIQWYRDALALRYQVQQSTDEGATWSTISTVREAGLWVYTYHTVVLADETTYHYRVIAEDELGNQSTPRYYHRYVVTTPAPLDDKVTIDYTGGNIVIDNVS